MRACCKKDENQIVEIIEPKVDHKIYHIECKMCGSREEIKKYDQTVKSFKVIIAGGRDFSDYNLLKSKCDNILSSKVKEGYRIAIISGKAKGADSLGERYARENGYEIKEFPANWSEHGKKAGPIRNEEMAKVGDALIAFWDSKSVGTRSMIGLAKKYNLLTRVINY